MNPITYKPTRLFITQNAKNGIKAIHDNPNIPLALEALRNSRTISWPKAQKTGFAKKIADYFKTKSNLTVVLGKENNGGFFINTNREIRHFRFTGKKVPVDINELATNFQKAEEAIHKSKEGILEELSSFNKNKKFFKFFKFFKF